MKLKLVLLVIILFSIRVNAQNKKVITSISKEICACLESYSNVQNIDEMEIALENCTMKTSIKYVETIKKELKIDLLQGEESSRQFGELIAFDMVKQCDVFIKFITKIAADIEYENDSLSSYKESSYLNPDLVPYERYTTDTMRIDAKQCKCLKNSRLEYITANENKNDFIILENKKGTEYHENNKYRSDYIIRRKKNCQFTATLKNSTSPEINNLLVPGDKVTYQILGIYGDKLYISLDLKGFSKTFQMNYTLLK